MAGKKKDHLDQTLALLQKKFGGDSAIRLGKGRQAGAQVTEVIPTEIEVVDHYALGVGGLPVGRMSEVTGEEASGKTTLGYQCLASCQRHGGVGVVLDAEHQFDETRARLFGVNVDDLIVLQPKHAEMGVEQTKLVLSSHNPKNGPMLMVWDTIAAMTPQADMGREAGERGTAELARVMSTELPKIMPLLVAHRAHLLALNQVRQAIGVMFGPNTITPGGKAVKFYASWRAQFFGGKAVKDPKTLEHTGKVVTLLVTKTRFTEPFRKMKVRLDYDAGWNNVWSTLDHAKARKVIAPRDAAGRGKKGLAAYEQAKVKLGWGPDGGALVVGQAAAAETDDGE
jgi:recombination protein RecA